MHSRKRRTNFINPITSAALTMLAWIHARPVRRLLRLFLLGSASKGRRTGSCVDRAATVGCYVSYVVETPAIIVPAPGGALFPAWSLW